MAEFQELIKNFDRTRDYIRQFFVYGYKSRSEFAEKSGRTYDNERRRLESWLGGYIQESHTQRGKQVSISVDSKTIPQNPLYGAWKSKSFTDRDIALHFFLLDCLWNQPEGKMARQLCDEMAGTYGQVYDSQTVRLKLKEYEELGILSSRKEGKSLCYRLLPGAEDEIALVAENERERGRALWEHLMTAVSFFQEAAPFGFVGSTILDSWQRENQWFQFKHHFLVHTLEDEILAGILCAMHEERRILVWNRGRRSGRITPAEGIPLRIFVSTQTGRRYLCMYQDEKRRFACFRLDSIQRTATGEICGDYQKKKQLLEKNLPWCWGVSFGAGNKKDRKEAICLRICLDEDKEDYIRMRLVREGRGGQVLRVGPGEYEYRGCFFDTGEMLAWVKSFTGRIREVSGDNGFAVNRLKRDFRRMAEMYWGEDGANACGGERKREKPGEQEKSGAQGKSGERERSGAQGKSGEQERPGAQEKTEKNAGAPSEMQRQENGNGTDAAFFRPGFLTPLPVHLFEEIYGCYYQITARILYESFFHPVTAERIREISLKYGYLESGSVILDRLTGGQWPFLTAKKIPEKIHGRGREKTAYRPVLQGCRFLEPGALPVTKLQKSWLRAILKDRRMPLFLTEEEITLALGWLGDQEALYRQEDFYAYDQYLDGDPYEEERYRKIFRSILTGMERRQVLRIIYESRPGSIWEGYAACGQLQYSARDDKFRLCCVTSVEKGFSRQRKSVLNVAKMRACSVCPEPVPAGLRFRPFSSEKRCSRPVEIAISGERNALERCMLHFASYEKHTRYDEESGRFICQIYYDLADETGLLIDVLSFGPVIQVLGPEAFLSQVKERVKRQWELMQYGILRR